MSTSQAALRTSALVMALAFPHHAAQEKTAHDAGQQAPQDVSRLKNGERCGGE
jgi:hypothetical protein